MRERGTGSLRLHGGVYQARYYDQRGRRIEVSAGTDNERKASAFLRKRLAEISEGTAPDPKHVTYERLRDAYMDYFQTEKKKSLRFRDGKPHLDPVARLDGYFSGFRASEIDAPVIRRFISELQKKGLANGTINRSTSALRRMFYLAQEDGTIRNVPTFPILEEKSAIRKGFIERPQYEALRAAVPGHLKTPLALGFFTGMRLGEILGLKWEQIDLLSGTIRLYPGETKSGEGREVPIPAPLKTVLLEQWAKRQEGCAYVCFRFDRKGRAVKLEGFRRAWQSACIRCGLGRMESVTSASGEPVLSKPRPDRKKAKAKPRMIYKGTIFHDLRRSAVRAMVRSHIPEKIAMGISGHATREIFDRYAGMNSGADLRKAAVSLAEFFENGDKTGTNCTEMQQPDLSIA